MGERDSSLARVQPVFNELLNRRATGEARVQRLCDMAASTRRGTTIIPTNIGSLLEGDTPSDPRARIGTVFERPVPAPARFSEWLITNADLMDCKDATSFGSRNVQIREWRRKLLRGSEEERGEARDKGLEGLRQTDVGARQGFDSHSGDA